MKTPRKHHRQNHEKHANTIDKTMKTPRQNQRQEKEKQASTIHYLEKSANVIHQTVKLRQQLFNARIITYFTKCHTSPK